MSENTLCETVKLLLLVSNLIRLCIRDYSKKTFIVSFIQIHSRYRLEFCIPESEQVLLLKYFHKLFHVVNFSRIMNNLDKRVPLAEVYEK